MVSTGPMRHPSAHSTYGCITAGEGVHVGVGGQVGEDDVLESPLGPSLAHDVPLPSSSRTQGMMDGIGQRRYGKEDTVVRRRRKQSKQGSH